jgi:hypothetical protein
LAPSTKGGDYSDIKGTGYVERHNILQCPLRFFIGAAYPVTLRQFLIIVKKNSKKGFYLINLAIRSELALPGETRVLSVGSSNRLK